ncbi:TetR family transcriptional regulator [Mycobacterium shigaense]|uniref:TetR family transcriptional regulator n=1 Tax=Mycobacterium shigaense TaxID=722731 RepID=A0A1Z4EE01_9MYCO|nr:TetR family transcriptional regulator [Mycobacterium shigaense]MEA1121759.1 TetR family transcriptional regulator [Mycobacterium shigaense]PRI16012.1 TetR family transcriptional regulator [Mycobacterium shigaense]BAX91185.1 TetR family transcriptional regulator [Mycobacterium shigaense]
MARPVSTPQVVNAAVRAAAKLGKDVADVPVAMIAAEAGISRSTLLRRFDGSRAALNDAVRAAGVDPGGLPPVRTRAVAAAAALISESGLAAATLEAVAANADCSVYSLHAVFGGRDELMRAVFERHSPVLDIEEYLAHPGGDLLDMVRGFYRTVANALSREPRIAPAIFAEAFARPTSPAVQSLAAYGPPRLLAVLGRWFEAEIRAGHIRDMPLPLLAQQLLGPIMLHVLSRPALPDIPAFSLPDIDTVCDIFAEGFVRAVAASGR